MQSVYQTTRMDTELSCIDSRQLIRSGGAGWQSTFFRPRVCKNPDESLMYALLGETCKRPVNEQTQTWRSRLVIASIWAATLRSKKCLHSIGRKLPIMTVCFCPKPSLPNRSKGVA